MVGNSGFPVDAPEGNYPSCRDEAPQQSMHRTLVGPGTLSQGISVHPFDAVVPVPQIRAAGRWWGTPVSPSTLRKAITHPAEMKPRSKVCTVLLSARAHSARAYRFIPSMVPVPQHRGQDTESGRRNGMRYCNHEATRRSFVETSWTIVAFDKTC